MVRVGNGRDEGVGRELGMCDAAEREGSVWEEVCDQEGASMKGSALMGWVGVKGPSLFPHTGWWLPTKVVTTFEGTSPHTPPLETIALSVDHTA